MKCLIRGSIQLADCRAVMVSYCLLVIVTIILLASPGFAQNPPMNGTFIVNNSGAGDYDSLSDAVDDLISRGVDGPVVFDIVSGIYSEHVSISEIPGSGAGNPITFRSQTGMLCDVTWSYSATGGGDNYVVRLDGADYITFEDICFHALGTNYAKVFDFTGGANNNTISGCQLQSLSTTSTSTHFTVIYVSTDLNENNTFTHSSFLDGSYGLYYPGSSLNPSSGITVMNCNFNNQVKTAIVVADLDAPLITENEITSPSASTGSYRCMYMNNCVNAITISKNKMNMSNGIACWIASCTGAVSNVGLVASNFFLTTGATTGNLIQLSNSSYFDAVYNSMLNTGNASGCLSITGTSSNLRLLNNIAVSTSGGYTLDVGTPSAITNSDYNNFYTTGGNLAYWDGSRLATLSDLQTASGMDANSISKSVSFVDGPNGDLHLTGGSLGDLDLIGSVFSRVTDDIDGDARGASVPYMGADENNQNPLPVELASLEARASQGHVVLRWCTATESNNYGFEVQRFNGGAWEVVGFVAGHGTTAEMQYYEFIDTEITAGRQQYRLKQIDTAGSFIFSPTIEVEIMLPQKYELRQNYPNPFNPHTAIAFSLPEPAPVEIAIFNTRGERVRLFPSSFKEAGSHLVFWNGGDDSGGAVASGIYYYSLSAHGNTLFTRQMTLVR